MEPPQFNNLGLERIREISTEDLSSEVYRSQYRRDYARLIHSPSFRRLCGKTQLFPGKESDYFRNRLTHSLEVAQISKSIAIKINHDLNLLNKDFRIDTDLVEFSALAHDLGHPPFGHLGEQALDEMMIEYGGFEGNAQTFRLLSTLEKKEMQDDKYKVFHGIGPDGSDYRLGLNLCFRSLASVLKYDNVIPEDLNSRNDYLLTTKQFSGNQSSIPQDQIIGAGPIKGYYDSDSDLICRIKESITGDPYFNNFKTIECDIMDIADDIAYSTFDLEDSFKAGFISPLDLLSANKEVIEEVVIQVNKKLETSYKSNDIKVSILNLFKKRFEIDDLIERMPDFKTISSFDNFNDDFATLSLGTITPYIYNFSILIATNGYVRNHFFSYIIGAILRDITIDYNSANPVLSKIKISPQTRLQIEVMKRITYIYQIQSPKLKIVEHRGKQIVRELFQMISDSNGAYLPHDQYLIYKNIAGSKPKGHSEVQKKQKRIICDFIANMTDAYASEFYGRLKSENPQTIHKPI